MKPKTIKLLLTIQVDIDLEGIEYPQEEIDKSYKIFKEDLLTEINGSFPFDQGVFSANIRDIKES